MSDTNIKRVNLLGKRFYEVEGCGVFPSVTTVLSSTGDKSGLEKWRKRVGEEEAKRIGEEATDRGTVMHKHLEIYLGEDLSKDKADILKIAEQKVEVDEEINQFNDRAKDLGRDLFMKFYNHSGFFPRIQETIFQERFLWFNTGELGYAGTVDNFSLLKDGTRKVIDFKTARKPKTEDWILDYKLQVSAYSIAIWQRFGIKPDGGEIWIANELTDEPQRFVLTFDEIKFFFSLFKDRLQRFYEIKKKAELNGVNI
jgi:genome maintenance exonuclease 1